MLGGLDLSPEPSFLPLLALLLVLSLGLVLAFALTLEVLQEPGHHEALLPRVARKRCTAAVKAARFCAGGVVAMTWDW